MCLLVRPHSTCTILERNNLFSTFKSQEWTKSIFFFYYHNQEMKSWWKCVVPENIHSPPTEGIGNSWVVGGSQRPKNLSKCVNLDWNFQRWGVGGGLRKNPLDNFWNHTINFMITYCHRNSSILKQILYMKINLENFYSCTSFKWPVSGYGENGREMEVGCSKEVGYKLV